MGLFDSIASAFTAPLTSVAEGIGGFVDNLTGKTALDAQKDMFNTSMAFNRENAQNAHQWEVADLEKAGLNPILSAGGKGAQTQGVTPPNVMGYGSGLRDLLFGTITSALDWQMQQKNIAYIDSLIANTDMDSLIKGIMADPNNGMLKNQIEMLMIQRDLASRQLGFSEKYGDLEHLINLIKTGTSSARDIAETVTSFIPKPKVQIGNIDRSVNNFKRY